LTLFNGANFEKAVLFDNTNFLNDVSFENVNFPLNSNVNFKHVKFHAKVNFSNVTLPSILDFTQAEAEQVIDLTKTKLDSITKTRGQKCLIGLIDAPIEKFIMTYDNFKIWKYPFINRSRLEYEKLIAYMKNYSRTLSKEDS